jgi:hypothetical protein
LPLFEHHQHSPSNTRHAQQGMASAFLQGTVGPILARGVAATVAAHPDDPVELLAEWLLK